MRIWDAIPVELVTRPAAALIPIYHRRPQSIRVPRIAQARDIPEEKVREVDCKVYKRQVPLVYWERNCERA